MAAGRFCRKKRSLPAAWVWAAMLVLILGAGDLTQTVLAGTRPGSAGTAVVRQDGEERTAAEGSWQEIRVERYTVTVPHRTQYCTDGELPQGTRRVLVEGSDGSLLRTARVTYENGVELEREVLSETMTLPPVTELIARGTGKEEQALPRDPVICNGYITLPTGEVLTYTSTATVRATAYTHTDAGCDMTTSTGTTVRWGSVAVDPRYIPYGTRMFIVSNDGEYVYGIAVAEDCGGDIKGDRMDLYMPSYHACIRFGRRVCTVYFLG